ncbi:MAG TPA: diphthine synthase [Methanosarcinales archaeon]|nr:diphthine synthase [Methanosarcinales archaeon]
MLTFVGIGLYDEKDITLKGLDAISCADRVFAEFYTSKMMGTTIDRMESQYQTKITVLSREAIEIDPSWLHHAKCENVVLLTGGDPLISTTHIDLRLRASDLGIATAVVHSASIVSAAPGLAGLQNYRFGKSATIPFPYHTRSKTVVSETPYNVIIQNLANNLHTMLFLDIDRDRGCMTIPEAVELLMRVDCEREHGTPMHSALGIGIARAGSPDVLIRCDRLCDLATFDFGAPMHLLIVPASLHPLEADALVRFADAPEWIR